MRVLITGGAGFIGSHITEVLAGRGDHVVILDNLSTGRRENVERLLGNGRVELVEDSVLDEKIVDSLMAEADVCFHLASAVGVELVVDHPLATTLSSVRGVDNVTTSATRHGTRLLFTSTSEIYGKNEGLLHEEADRVLGASTTHRWTYATAKAFGEILALGYAREHGAEMITTRLFNTVGPRQVSAYGMVLPRFVRQALAGEELTVYGDGTQARCFTHVDDTVDALISLIETDGAVGNVYNVGCNREVKIIELANLVLEATESPSPVRLIPYEEAFGEGFEELGRRRPDCTALTELTGWRPRRTVIDAVEDVIEHQLGRTESSREPALTAKRRTNGRIRTERT